MPIGDISKERGDKTRRRVWLWFQDNPCSTKMDAAKALNLGTQTVGRHARAIRDGWRPKADGDAL